MSQVVEQGATRWVNPSDYLPKRKRAKVRPQKVEIKPQVRRLKAVSDPRYPRGPRGKGSPFIPKPRLRPGFGRGLPFRTPLPDGRLDPRRWIGRRFPLLRIIGLWDDLNDWIPNNNGEGDTWPVGFIPPGWALQRQCNPPVRVNGCSRKQQNCGTATNCLSGQAGTNEAFPVYLPANVTRFALNRAYSANGFPYVKYDRWYIASPCNSSPRPARTIWGPAELVSYAPPPGLNPNIQRRLPSLKPKPEPVAYPNLAAPPPPVVGRAVEFGPTGRRNVSPRGRQPPPPREDERKFFSKSAKVAAGIFAGLDTISELSEIVDVFYDALPSKVKRQWEAKHSDKRGLLDQAGQYGISGADWKARAVFWNFHKIDADKAFKGIVNNQTQDFIHGLLHRNLPVNTGRAVDPGVKAMEKFLKEHLYLD